MNAHSQSGALSLHDRVAVVTGAAGGLGRTYALALAQAGAAVVVNDIGAAVDGQPATGGGPGAVVQQIRARGGRALGILESVVDARGVQRVVEETVAAFGRLDILVNNAGIVRSHPIVAMSEEDFDAVLAVHLRGSFLCTREAMRVMRQAGRGGRIINTTSGRAYDGHSAGTANSAAAKGGIISLTGVTAVEGKESGITCNAVSPAASATYLGDDADSALIAPLVVFLASPAAAEITGQVFHIARKEISVVRSVIGSAIRPCGAQWTAEEIAERIAAIVPPA